MEKGKKYKDADNIIIIYLTKKDIFKKGSTVYEVKMNVMSDIGILTVKDAKEKFGISDIKLKKARVSI